MPEGSAISVYSVPRFLLVSALPFKSLTVIFLEFIFCYFKKKKYLA